VIGHRGACAAAPENTLPSFKLALQAKPDMVELDYYHSVDGIPFVFHDSTLDRTTNSRAVLGKNKLPVGNVPWEQLRQLDAGAWFNAKFKGTRIPTLDESIDCIQQGSVTLIERKGGDAATIVTLLKKKQLLDQVVVQAFDWDYLRECHRLAPDLALGALGSKALSSKRLAEINTTGAKAVGWKHTDIGTAEVKRVHEAGLKLWVYTVNDPADMRRLIRLGVDGLITDRPDVARQVVAE
jgi:glycerophosphoryl diester phosphodiesterase